MNIGQLKKVLKAAADLQREAGNPEAARDLLSVTANLLKDKESETVAAFVKRVVDARNPPERKSAANKSKRGTKR